MTRSRKKVLTGKIYAPRVNYFGHAPRILKSENGEYSGCSCGWRSIRPSKTALYSWWRHAMDTHNGRPPR